MVLRISSTHCPRRRDKSCWSTLQTAARMFSVTACSTAILNSRRPMRLAAFVHDALHRGGDDVGQVVLVFLAGEVPYVEPQGLFHELAAAGAVVAFVEGIHLLQQGGANPQGEFPFQVFFCHSFLHPFVDPGGDTRKNGLPPGNFVFLTPSVTPRPPNRPRKMGKLTPGKNPGTTGSAGRSDPARDACGRPRAFHLLVFSHLSPLLIFWGNRSPGGRSKAGVFSICAGGCFPGWAVFFSFLPNWALCGPNRPLTGRGRVVPPPGAETGQNRPPGGETGGLAWFCGAAGCEWFPQCREERKGRRIPLEGSGQDLRHLPGLSKGCKEAMRTSVLFSLHTICSRFCYHKHKMSKCAPRPFAPLHPSFFSQPIPLVGQTDGLYIAS